MNVSVSLLTICQKIIRNITNLTISIVTTPKKKKELLFSKHIQNQDCRLSQVQVPQHHVFEPV